MSKPRILSIYERNQLLKYTYTEEDLLAQGDLPIEYLTGKISFANLELSIDRRALIPRVETEELVAMVCDYMANQADVQRYVEVGCGSGAISAAVYNYLQHHRRSVTHFLVSDIAQPCIDLAMHNFQQCFGIQSLAHVVFVKSDLLAQIALPKIDVLVANLPYIPTQRITSLAPSVRDFEPHLALDGGPTGFEIVYRLLKQVLETNRLHRQSRIFLEVDDTHTEEFLQQHFSDLFVYFKIKAYNDQYQKNRFLVLELL